MCRIEAGDARGEQGGSDDMESTQRSSQSRAQSQQPLDRPREIDRRPGRDGDDMSMDVKPAAPPPVGLAASDQSLPCPPPSPHDPDPVALVTMDSVSSTMTEASTASAVMQGAHLRTRAEAEDEERAGGADGSARSPIRKLNQVVGRVVGRFTCYGCRQAKKPCDKRNPCGR